MRPYDSLLRMAQHALDGVRQEIAELHRKDDQLKEQREELEQQIEREGQLVAASPSYGFAFLPFVARATRKIEAIEHERQQLAFQIADAQTRLMALFAERKKLETAHETKLEELRVDRQRKEDSTAQEMAVNLSRWARESGDNPPEP